MRMLKVAETPSSALYAKNGCKACFGTGVSCYINKQPVSCKCLKTATKEKQNAG
jgi:hypothetical protein